MYIEAHDGELDAETAAGSGLAGGGGPGHQNETHRVAFAVNHVGNLGVALLVQGF